MSAELCPVCGNPKGSICAACVVPIVDDLRAKLAEVTADRDRRRDRGYILETYQRALEYGIEEIGEAPASYQGDAAQMVDAIGDYWAQHGDVVDGLRAEVATARRERDEAQAALASTLARESDRIEDLARSEQTRQQAESERAEALALIPPVFESLASAGGDAGLVNRVRLLVKSRRGHAEELGRVQSTLARIREAAEELERATWGCRDSDGNWYEELSSRVVEMGEAATTVVEAAGEENDE